MIMMSDFLDLLLLTLTQLTEGFRFVAHRYLACVRYFPLYTRSRTREKCISSTSCLCVCISSTATGQIFVNFDAGDFVMKTGLEKPNFVKIGAKLWQSLH